VVLLTSNVEKIYPSKAVVKVSRRKSKAMADQLTTVNKLRLTNRMGRLSGSDLANVEHTTMLQLGMETIAG
jgi:mRNA interferase MazF